MSIAKITKMYTRRYLDNRQTTTYIEWLDTHGIPGRTEGERHNPHMLALIARGTRESLKLTSETW